MKLCRRENFNEKFHEIFMQFLKFSTRISLPAGHSRFSISGCDSSRKCGLGHTATGQSHACKIDLPSADPTRKFYQPGE